MNEGMFSTTARVSTGSTSRQATFRRSRLVRMEPSSTPPVVSSDGKTGRAKLKSWFNSPTWQLEK